MAERDTFIRSLHDLGMAAWFGGSLMGAVGVNGAAGAAKDPSERLRLSSIGWAKWAPVQILAVGVHAVGGIGLMVSNRKRLGKQPGAGSASECKVCPLCQLIGVVNTLKPDVLAHLTEAGFSLVAAYKAATEAAERSWTSGDRPPVQHIKVT